MKEENRWVWKDHYDRSSFCCRLLGSCFLLLEVSDIRSVTLGRVFNFNLDLMYGLGCSTCYCFLGYMPFNESFTMRKKNRRTKTIMIPKV